MLPGIFKFDRSLETGIAVLSDLLVTIYFDKKYLHEFRRCQTYPCAFSTSFITALLHCAFDICV